jgi:flagellar biosynthesis chaperone FliJ
LKVIVKFMRLHIIFALVFLALPGLAQAVSVQPGQETIELAVERGGEASFFLIANYPAHETLASSSPWVKIEGNDSFVLPSGGTAFLRINVSVPADQDIGKYKADIKYGSATLSTIIVTVTLPTEEIKTLRTLADVNEKISGLESNLDSSLEEQLNDIKEQISTIKSDLSISIQDMKNYQKQVSDLEGEKKTLEEKIRNLTEEIASLENRTLSLQAEKQELELTGNMLRSESPVLFLLGILAGAGGIYLFHRKLHKYL